MSLKSSNKTDTNVYTLEIEIGAEPFKAAVLKAYNKAKGQIGMSLMARETFVMSSGMPVRS